MYQYKSSRAVVCGMPPVDSAQEAEARSRLCSWEGTQNQPGHLGVTPRVYRVQREGRSTWAEAETHILLEKYVRRQMNTKAWMGCVINPINWLLLEVIFILL